MVSYYWFLLIEKTDVIVNQLYDASYENKKLESNSFYRIKVINIGELVF
jgi:hypothetical protein